MLTRTNQKNKDELSILGFGCMRFPQKGTGIDEARSIAMIRSAIEQGVNYFDTAYFYHGGKSESLLGDALSGGYRERVKVATKLPPFMVSKLEGAKKIFDNQCTKLQTNYIDYYLLHMLTDKATLDRMISIGVMDWLEQLKKEGTIHNIGFSFHGGKADFEQIISAYPWDFCQIQYNYLDENNQATKSGLQLAASLGIPVIVMEPLRGGKLVNNLPDDVVKAFKSSDAKRTPAEWALRWIWNHPEVSVILSGMGDEQQLAENIAIASNATANSLSKEELDVFEKVKKIMLERTKVPCTACGYCMPCPHGVNIPGCFASYNDKYLLNTKNNRLNYMQTQGVMSKKPSYASLCTECGKCELHCPQNISIRKELKQVKKELEGPLFKPVVAVARKIMKVK
ncbi:MAG: putative oxidoreductase of aldo/keto reductase family [Firmicutes bacterium]|nr:putative oxidoreductase of aldo/keto reductase family [Bacillota bacterium]